MGLDWAPVQRPCPGRLIPVRPVPGDSHVSGGAVGTATTVLAGRWLPTARTAARMEAPVAGARQSGGKKKRVPE